MAKYGAFLLAAALLAAPAGRAETVVRADWEKARAMLAQSEFRPRIRVELKSSQRVMVTKGTFHDRKRTEVELKPSKWVKGKLIEATDAGLQVVFRREEISFLRDDISRIRLVPRKADRTKNRWIGILGGVPAGYGAGLVLSSEIACRSSDCIPGLFYSLLVGTTLAVTYVFYKLGLRADRGAVLVVLDESTANKPPVPQ